MVEEHIIADEDGGDENVNPSKVLKEIHHNKTDNGGDDRSSSHQQGQSYTVQRATAAGESMHQHLISSGRHSPHIPVRYFY